MKASKFTSTCIAAVLVLGSASAFAQYDRGRQRQADEYQRQHNRPTPQAHRSQGHFIHPGYAYRNYAQPAYTYRNYAQPTYTYRGYAPTVSYSAPYSHWRRGDRMPHNWRSQYYVVNDWHSYNNLYAPPYGHQWVRADSGDYLLIALATGVIANLLMHR